MSERRVRVREGWQRTHDPALAVRAGDLVRCGRTDAEWPGWVWCGKDGSPGGWLPEKVLECLPDHPEARIVADFDTRELTVAAGAVLAVLATELGWHLCRADNGETGWVPERNTAPI